MRCLEKVIPFDTADYCIEENFTGCRFSCFLMKDQNRVCVSLIDLPVSSGSPCLTLLALAL